MWVEMLYLLVSCAKLARHPPREDVSWNAYTYAKEPEAFRHPPREDVSWNTQQAKWLNLQQRHPPREDVSWNSVAEMFVDNLKSHPPREDVSWNIPTNAMHHRRVRHPPREDVSWNINRIPKLLEKTVILLVRMWVEIFIIWWRKCNRCVILLVRMWVEILNFVTLFPFLQSSSSWGCELKYKTDTARAGIRCHPPREDVSWNIFWSACSTALWVILLVRMWVEIPCPWVILEPDHVILLVRMWVEMTYRNYNHLNMSSSSSWGCELK